MRDSAKEFRERACALYYDETRAAPTLIAKGEGRLAQTIREIAQKHNVPLIKDADTATALAQLEIGDEIPFELYEAVAKILAFIYRLYDERETGQ